MVKKKFKKEEKILFPLRMMFKSNFYHMLYKSSQTGSMLYHDIVPLLRSGDVSILHLPGLKSWPTGMKLFRSLSVVIGYLKKFVMVRC